MPATASTRVDDPTTLIVAIAPEVGRGAPRAALYDLLAGANPSPVVELNRAVAVAMADGLEAGLRLMDRPEVADPLQTYRWFHAARGDLLRRLGRLSEAAAGYARALELTENAVERAYLRRRLDEVSR